MAARFWVGSGATWNSSGTTHWSATSGGAGGASVPGSGDTVTLDANSGGGTITPNYDFIVTSINMNAFTGTLDFSVNNNNPTLTTFNNSGTGIRGFNMGNGTWTITGNAATVWTQNTTTNLIFNANGSTLNFTYSGSTGTRAINPGAALTYKNLNITAGSDTVSISTLVLSGNFSSSGFTGINMLTANSTIGGNFTIGSGSTYNSTSGSLTLNGSSTSNINTNGIAINRNVNINGTGTFNLLNNIDISSSSTGIFQFTTGTFNTNNFNITAKSYNSTTGIRVLNAGSTTLSLLGTGTVFNETLPNLTLSAGTFTIKITDTSSSAKTFNATGGETFYNLWLASGTSVVNITATSGTTVSFNNIRVDAPLTVVVKAGVILSANTITWGGTAGNINTFQSDTPGTQWFLNMTSNVNIDYVSLKDSFATGGAWYYATPHSINGGNNSGWIFLPPGTAGNFLNI